MKYGIFTLVLSGVVLLSACKKENKDRYQGPGSSVPNPVSSLLSGMKVPTQVFHSNTAEDDTFKTAGGLYFTVMPGSFTDASGAELDSETVDISVRECYKDGDYIQETIGTAGTGKEVYQAIGTYRVEATYQGKAVTLIKPIRFFFPLNDPVSNAEKLHVSQLTDNSDKTDGNQKLWETYLEHPHAVYDTPSAAYHYMVPVSSYGWYQLDKRRDLSDLAFYELEMPLEVTAKKCVAILMLPSRGITYLTVDEARNRFNTYGYRLPADTPVRVLLVEKSQGVQYYRYNLETLKVSGAEALLHFNGNTKDISKGDLENLIRGL